MILADGVAVGGEATVNQSTMTGESEPVHRTRDQSVFAGTILEEGELTVRVTALAGGTRVDEIARLIDESESRKALVQTRAESMADMQRSAASRSRPVNGRYSSCGRASVRASAPAVCVSYRSHSSPSAGKATVSTAAFCHIWQVCAA